MPVDRVIVGIVLAVDEVGHCKGEGEMVLVMIESEISDILLLLEMLRQGHVNARDAY